MTLLRLLSPFIAARHDHPQDRGARDTVLRGELIAGLRDAADLSDSGESAVRGEQESAGEQRGGGNLEGGIGGTILDHIAEFGVAILAQWLGQRQRLGGEAERFGDLVFRQLDLGRELGEGGGAAQLQL